MFKDVSVELYLLLITISSLLFCTNIRKNNIYCFCVLMGDNQFNFNVEH